jgi:hypothetical protein
VTAKSAAPSIEEYAVEHTHLNNTQLKAAGFEEARATAIPSEQADTVVIRLSDWDFA